MKTGETVGLRSNYCTDGIKNAHYFNGRLLTADALQDEQAASRAQHRQLAAALGHGVVHGLEVSVADASTTLEPVLRVSEGLAFNRNGEAVALRVSGGVQVALTREASGSSVGTGVFSECLPPTKEPTNPGTYILTARPISSPAEWAPKSGYLPTNAKNYCDRRYDVEGLEFHLIETGALSTELTALAQAANDASAKGKTQLAAIASAAVSKYRSALAHWCLGTGALDPFAERPFEAMADSKAPLQSYGGLDALRVQGILTCCDVPLALVYWTKQGLQFVDTWAVRRPLVPPERSSTWVRPMSLRREAEGHAALLQFQQQLADLVTHSGSVHAVRTLQAKEFFVRVPAVGLLPLWNGSRRGFEYQQFFAGETLREPSPPPYASGSAPVFIEGRNLEALLRTGLQYDAVQLGTEEFLWIYRVRENRQAIDTATANAPQPYVVFASGSIPYFGTPDFDLNRWGYANYT
ncbi:MAG: hypothetical protein JW940_32695 [Polyangiaceae bacterium]|nr:hypothetical protein [Polyangiaceae bacterium]